jgi:WD40 repeat protein
LEHPTNYIYAVTFTDDGRTLAATSTDGTVWLWNVSDRQHPIPVATLTLPNDSVFPVDFHPDQRALVAAGAEEAVWIWLTDPDLAARHVCATTGDPITRSEWATYVPDRPYQSPCHQ